MLEAPPEAAQPASTTTLTESKIEAAECIECIVESSESEGEEELKNIDSILRLDSTVIEDLKSKNAPIELKKS